MSNYKRILITGGSGRVGSRLVEGLESIFLDDFPENVDLLMHENQIEINFSSSLNVRVVEHVNREYDLAIHLAANANTRFTENPEYRESVRESNVGLTQKVCDYSDKVIFTSTDQVFKGDLREGEEYFEDDERNPCSFYGQTKAEAEDVVLNSNGCVLRFQTVTGVKNRITGKAIDVIKGGKEIPFYSDNILKTTHLPDVIKVLRMLAESFRGGVYHIASNGEPLSRYEMAKEILRTYQDWGIYRVRDNIKGETHLEIPRRLSLNSDKAQKEFGFNFTDVKQSLREQALWEYDK